MTKKSTPEEINDVEPPRRRFFNKLWAFLGMIALAELIWVVLSYLKPVRNQEAMGEFGGRIMAGPTGSFEPNSVTAFPRGHFYLACLKDGGFLAIHRKCTHLGCTVPWVEEEQQFVCPCHSSAFDIQGAVIRSPANRALDIFPVFIENNVVFVDTGQAKKRSAFSPDQVEYPN
jgi:cytochrome b6-f complex iron-sulfur subunit